ncbi:MAG: hypothetical protein JJU29_03465 [Verrucomicrobia bacterium]|nr:hypothetical protein [Verrucomicrobiota bacterium]MCH8512555.1 hypothetical protein [Kiritimatiellia bacterium]
MSPSSPCSFPRFDFSGLVLEAKDLRYAPHPDIIHPSVLSTAGRIPNAVAPYLMYYAPHDAPGGICLALADRPEGPWREVDGNPLIHAAWPPHHAVSHVSSPHAVWHEKEQRVFLYYHGENDTTRYAVSVDGVHFTYGGIAVDTAMLESGVTEASYARVFPWRDGYVMFLMGNHQGTRKIYKAFSEDARRWRTAPEAWISPPPGYGQMGPGSLMEWNHSPWLICFGNVSDAPEFEPVSDLLLYQLSPDLAQVDYQGILLPHTAAGPENRRINDPCLLEMEGKRYLYVNVGRRLQQNIGLVLETASRSVGSDRSDRSV